MRLGSSLLLTVLALVTAGASPTPQPSPRIGDAKDFAVLQIGPHDTLMKIASRVYGQLGAWKRIRDLNGDLVHSPHGPRPGDVVLLDRDPKPDAPLASLPAKPVYGQEVCAQDLARCCGGSDWKERGLYCLRKEPGKCVSVACKIFVSDVCAFDRKQHCAGLDGSSLVDCIQNKFISSFSPACIHRINPCRGIWSKVCPGTKLGEERTLCMLSKKAQLPPLCASELELK